MQEFLLTQPRSNFWWNTLFLDAYRQMCAENENKQNIARFLHMHLPSSAFINLQ